MKNDDFMSVTPDAMAKERFVIVDAIGVCENEDLNETRPLEQSSLPLEKLLKVLQYGKPTEELVSTLVSKLSRLQKKLTTKQIEEIQKLADGKSLSDFNKSFVNSIDEDEIYDQAQHEFGEKGKENVYEPTLKEIESISQRRMNEVLKTFIGNASLMQRLLEIKKETEQIIDIVSIDVVEEASFSSISKVKAKQIVSSFKEFIIANRKELAALQLFYSKGKMDWNDLKEVVDKIKTPPYSLTPSKLWYAYQQLETDKVHGKFNRIADFISMLNFELGRTSELEPYLDTVDKRFAEWLGRQKESGVKFSQEQLNWLEKIKDHIATSVEILPEDFESAPFSQIGGLGKATNVFGKEKLKPLLVELNSKVGG
jgi:type I restriction enzyme R subunit